MLQVQYVKPIMLQIQYVKPIMLQVYYVITDVATMVQEVADHQDMLRSLSESKLPGQKLALRTEIRQGREQRAGQCAEMHLCISAKCQCIPAHCPSILIGQCRCGL